MYVGELANLIAAFLFVWPLCSSIRSWALTVRQL